MEISFASTIKNVITAIRFLVGKDNLRMKISKIFLLAAGILSFSVALFQAVITFSPVWSRYFGAPEEFVTNPALLYVAGLAAAVIFAIFGLYALSGAGYVRTLPMLRMGLLAIGCIYTLRGLVVIPILLITMGYIQSSDPVPPTGLSSSVISLLIGLIYLIGTFGCWQNLRLVNKR